jgi:hypothetical protein
MPQTADKYSWGREPHSLEYSRTKSRAIVYDYGTLKTAARREQRREPEPQDEPLTAADEAEFRHHVERWRKEALAYSSIARKIAHPDYLAIVGMQKKVIPLLLRELAERPTYWFAALKTLAKDEQTPEEPTSFDAAVKAWLDWGKKRGYLQERGTTRS